MDALKMAKLDYASNKSSSRVYPIMLVVICVFFIWGQGSSLSTLFMTLSWYVGLVLINTFQVEEKDSLRRLYGTLALKVKDIVLGRYIYFITYYLFSILLVLASYGILGQFFALPVQEFAQAFFFGSLSFAIFALLIGTIIPGLIKFGFAKGRAFFIAPFALISLGTLFLNKLGLGEKLIGFFFNNMIKTALIALVLSLGVLVISYFISLRVYRS